MCVFGTCMDSTVREVRYVRSVRVFGAWFAVCIRMKVHAISRRTPSPGVKMTADFESEVRFQRSRTVSTIQTL